MLKSLEGHALLHQMHSPPLAASGTFTALDHRWLGSLHWHLQRVSVLLGRSSHQQLTAQAGALRATEEAQLLRTLRAPISNVQKWAKLL